MDTAKRPLISMILIIVSISLFLFNILVALLWPGISPSFTLYHLFFVIGAAFLLLGTILYKKPFFFGIGLLVLASATVVSVLSLPNFYLNIPTVCGYLVLGLYYLLGGKLGTVTRCVCAGVILFLENIFFVSALISYASATLYEELLISLIITNLLSFLLRICICIAVILFPVKKAQAEIN